MYCAQAIEFYANRVWNTRFGKTGFQHASLRSGNFGTSFSGSGGGWRGRRHTSGSGGEPPHPVALELYSIREDCARDLAGTLGAVAKMGYDSVEFAGYYEHTAKEVRAILDEVRRDGSVWCHNRFFGCAPGSDGTKADLVMLNTGHA